VNPYWKFPPNPTKELYPIAEEFETSSTKVEKRYISPKEPLYQIPFSVAEKKNIEHQVRAGRGERYSHAINRPEYLDSFNKPYAVFRFKYRTREHLKNMFPGAIPDEEPKVLVEELKGMSEEEKIAEILKLNEKLEGIKNNGENGKAVTGSRAHNLTTQAPTHVKGWVQDQQQRSQGNPYAATSRSPFVQRSTQIRWGDVPNSPRATSSRRASAQELHRVRSTEAGWNGGSRDVGGFEAGWGVDGNDKGWTGGRDDNSWKDEGGGWDSGDTRPRNRKW
jgi:hypothetical protein